MPSFGFWLIHCKICFNVTFTFNEKQVMIIYKMGYFSDNRCFVVLSGFFENTCILNIYMCIGNISILHTVSPEVNNVLLTSSFKKIKISLLDNVQCMI